MHITPEEVVIELTSRCNFSCIHCGSDCVRGTFEDELNINDWRFCLDQLRSMDVKKVVFSGGEPIIKPEFNQIIEYCGIIGLKYGFITNGFRLSNKTLSIIEKNKPFAVGISIDGCKNTHNTIRNNSKSWRKVLETVSKIQSIGVQICVVTTVNQLNYNDLDSLACLLNLLEVDSWQIQLAMPAGRMEENAHLLIDEEIFYQLCLKIISYRKLYPDINIEAADCFGLVAEDSVRKKFGGGCGAGVTTFGIDAFGNILPCLSIRSGLTCGNIKENPLVEIWNSVGFEFNRNFDKRKAGELCKDCKWLVNCKGGCNSQSLAYFGELHNSPFCYARTFSSESMVI